jgi:hypothetical protein
MYNKFLYLSINLVDYYIMLHYSSYSWLISKPGFSYLVSIAFSSFGCR